MAEKPRYRKTSYNFTRHEKICLLGVYPKLIAFYLLAGWGNKVGLCNLYPGAAAEECGMSEQTFRKHLKTVCDALGWKYDRKYKLLYIPTWWKHNQPEGANVLKHNLKDLYELPRCELMLEFLENTRHLPKDYHYLLAAMRRELFPDNPGTDVPLPPDPEETPTGKIESSKEASPASDQAEKDGAADPSGEVSAGLRPVKDVLPTLAPEPLKQAKPTRKKRYSAQDMRPEWISEKDWLDLLEHRKKKGSPLSKKPVELLIRQLSLAKENGHSPHDCIEEIITRGWKSFKAEWMGAAKKEPEMSPGEAECLRTKRMLDAKENRQPPSPMEELMTETGFLVYEGRITQEQRTAILSGKVKLDDVLQPAPEQEEGEQLLLPGPEERGLELV